MDAWDNTKVASLSASDKAKYDRRYQMGDVVEVREDGYWDKRGFDKSAFCVVKVPGLALDEDKMTALYDDDIEKNPLAKMIRRRKWQAKEAKIPQAAKDAIESADRVVTVTSAQAAAFIERHT